MTAEEDEYPADWKTRSQVSVDMATPALVDRLAATLDYEAPPWPAGFLPPLGHWLLHLPITRQSGLAPDGHPAAGALLPTMPGKRRMWAGSRVTFHAPLPVAVPIERRTTVIDIRTKEARSGPLVFVTLQHLLFVRNILSLTEEQDLVFRPANTVDSIVPPEIERDATCNKALRVEHTAMFRYSALTFNAHRIHYDQAYSRSVENYPDLVVQGPFLATIMLHGVLKSFPGVIPVSFSFRANKPIFVGQFFELKYFSEIDHIQTSISLAGLEAMVGKIIVT